MEPPGLVSAAIVTAVDDAAAGIVPDDRHEQLTLGVVCTVTFLDVVDGSIRQRGRCRPSGTASGVLGAGRVRVVSAYLITYGGSLLLGGAPATLAAAADRRDGAVHRPPGLRLADSRGCWCGTAWPRVSGQRR